MCLHDTIMTLHTCHDPGFHVTDVRLPEPGLGEDVDKHCGGAVNGGALFSLNSLNTRCPIEARTGDDISGAVDEATESASNISEAVVERDGNTDSVRLK